MGMRPIFQYSKLDLWNLANDLERQLAEAKEANKKLLDLKSKCANRINELNGECCKYLDEITQLKAEREKGDPIANQILQAACADGDRVIDELRARCARLEEALKRVEWVENDAGWFMCQVCFNERAYGHTKQCLINAALEEK